MKKKVHIPHAVKALKPTKLTPHIEALILRSNLARDREAGNEKKLQLGKH